MASIREEVVKRKLEEKNLTVRDIERMAGVKRGVFYNIVRGNVSNPTITSAVSLAEILECSIQELLGQEAETPPAPAQQHPWNDELFISATQTAAKQIKAKGLHLTLQEALYYIQEIYTYSIKNPKSKSADANFAEWLFERGGKLS